MEMLHYLSTRGLLQFFFFKSVSLPSWNFLQSFHDDLVQKVNSVSFDFLF